MRILVLLTDAYGGHGGIAKFNRDLLAALCASPLVDSVTAVPRLGDAVPTRLPSKLHWDPRGLGGKLRYSLAALRAARHPDGFDLVICGHINLLPVASICRFLTRRTRREHGVGEGQQDDWTTGPEGRDQKSEIRGQGVDESGSTTAPPTHRRTDAPTHRPTSLLAPCSLLLLTHGIEAWQPTRSRLVNRLTPRVDGAIAVSALTRDRLCAWTGLPTSRVQVLPNCVDVDRFTPGPRNPGLLKRYGLEGKRVLLTVARLDARERYKGIDEVLEVLPELRRENPELVYLVCGDGTDRPRLESRARALGLGEVVRFSGFIPEEEKVDHYRLADAFVMPGTGEGFGIVYLEAMACGVPVVASRLDASQEAVEMGKLGVAVNPRDPHDLITGIDLALAVPVGAHPPGLADMSFERYRGNVHRILSGLAHTEDTEEQRSEVRGQRAEGRSQRSDNRRRGSAIKAAGDQRLGI